MQMTNLRFVESQWAREFDLAISSSHSEIQIVCPFIKSAAIDRILRQRKQGSIQVVTRFDLCNFEYGVSDISALKAILGVGALIRGVKNLHAKVYRFGKTSIVTSANLTDAAMYRNHEFGVVSEDQSVSDSCKVYFEDLWLRAGENLTSQQLSEWESEIEDYRNCGKEILADRTDLLDYGTDLEIPTSVQVPMTWTAQRPDAFVKFFGESDNRASRSANILDLVSSSGCHWACTYPRDKRPRGVPEGSTMFMARMTSDPNDILIYGQAIGRAYQEGRDDASPADILARNWKVTWPHYIRVHGAKFIAGSLHHGISLNELMDSLQYEAFASTQRNADSGSGNIDPRRAYLQQPAVMLTSKGTAWLEERLNLAYEKHGQLSASEMATLDRPLYSTSFESESDERYTTKAFKPEQLKILKQIELAYGTKVVSRVQVREWYTRNKKTSKGVPYEYGPAWIVKNRFIVKASSTTPGDAECVLDPNELPEYPNPRVR